MRIRTVWRVKRFTMVGRQVGENGLKRMSKETVVAETAPEAVALPMADLRRDYVTTFLTEVLVITSYLVAFRLVAVHLGQNGFGEYALSRRTLSLVSPLAVIGLDVAVARFVAYAMGRRTGREAGYPGAALLIMAVTLAVLSALLLVFQSFFADLFFGSSTYTSLITPLPGLPPGPRLPLLPSPLPPVPPHVHQAT